MSLEILFNYEGIQRKNIKSKSDAVVCSIHACLISKNYKCIGNGEEFPCGTVRGSDMLPTGWNESVDCYSLMYQQQKSNEKFLLKILNMDNVLLVHLMRGADQSVVDLELVPSDFVTDDMSTFESAFRDPDRLLAKLESELLSRKGASYVSDKESPRRQLPSPNITPRSYGVGGIGCVPGCVPNRSQDPFQIGRNDLDPFATGSGSGMIFDPMHSGYGPTPPMGPYGGRGPGGIPDPSRIPMGSVPPGARFDPIGPSFDPSRTMDPDPDELRPPDYDNMFM